MDILHEWELERYGKFDTQTQNGWSTIEDRGNSVKILSSRQFVISTPSAVVESFSLFNPAMWLKCFQRGDSLLMLHKIKDLTRKFRLKFKAVGDGNSLDICNDVVKVLRQYLHVTNMDSQPPSQSQPMEQETTQSLSGEVSQSSLTQAILGINKFTLPTAYSSCNYPTEELDTLVRLCIMDPSFPAFVVQVEKVLKTVTSDK